MAAQRPRPLSPHLTIWKWGPHMLVSIIHRVTGGALTVVGLALLTWWLLSLATGGDTYGKFAELARHPIGLIVLIGVTWAFFQHLLSGVRHLAMDSGQNFELKGNKTSAIATLVISLLLTAALWFYLMGVGR